MYRLEAGDEYTAGSRCIIIPFIRAANDRPSPDTWLSNYDTHSIDWIEQGLTSHALNTL